MFEKGLAALLRGTRQFPTGSLIWRLIRAEVLRRQPVCVACWRAKATDVDHIDGNAWNNAPANLQGLCHPCHSRKTARFDGGFGR